MADDKVIDQARAYIAARTEVERAALIPSIKAFDGDLNEVIDAIRPTPHGGGETGWMFDCPFRSPRLRGQYPEQSFMLYVPPDYHPSKPRGLAIWLHGGGQGRGPVTRKFFEDHAPANAALEASGRILCYPSAPPSDRSWSRWQLPEADEYLADVIEEIGWHYAVDPNDMILAGGSMGGMGAYHHAHRLSDRFSSFFAAYGHWDFACWRALMGTHLWIYHGINDAILFRRRHGTDIEFARLARRRLEESGLPFTYREVSGCHSMADGIWVLREWLDWCRNQRRDPFFPHVVAVSPRGLSPWTDWHRHKTPLAAHENVTDFHSIAHAPHTRWVTIDALGTESVIFDMVTMSACADRAEGEWNDFALTLKRKHVPAGIVEALLNPDGSIDASPRNVSRFTLWLHPEMTDLNDVRIRVRGKERFHGAVRPDLATVLDSYLRRRDWGLLYPARVTIEDDGTWSSRDQLNLH